jgi:HlyD family secretion protein
VIENEKPKQIKVKTGISDGNNTELVQGELKEGRDVIIESIAKGKAENKTAGPGMMR